MSLWKHASRQGECKGYSINGGDVESMSEDVLERECMEVR